MKLAILTIAFAARRFIPACLEQFQPLGARHLVLVSDQPHRGGDRDDGTALLAAELGAEVETGDWPTQPDQLNHGLQMLHDYDWVIIADVDEFYTADDLSFLLATLESTAASGVVAPKMKVYWKTGEWRLIPDQNDSPLVAVRPSQRFHHMRQCECEKAATVATMHHFSYVRNDEEMIRKLRSFEHSDEFDIEQWYRDVWLPWTPASTNLHPLFPAQFAQAIHDPAPAEIRTRLPE